MKGTRWIVFVAAGTMTLGFVGVVAALPPEVQNVTEVFACNTQWEPDFTLGQNGVDYLTVAVVEPDGKARVTFENIEDNNTLCPNIPSPSHRPSNDADGINPLLDNNGDPDPDPWACRNNVNGTQVFCDGASDCFGGAITATDGVAVDPAVAPRVRTFEIDMTKAECQQAAGDDDIIEYHCNIHTAMRGKILIVGA